MEWLEELGIIILDNMLAVAWHHIKSVVLHRLTQIINAKHPSPTVRDIEIVHQSPHYIIVNKRHDVLINSNNPLDEVCAWGNNPPYLMSAL
ncbi:hypothetical protein SK128_023355 [Halocaridina rubra]|uniref:Uncharacterized protein n=1 Tax=Halocaridina rubra TaxID=373956 RepID=A0AAN8ZU97_HALRR